MTRARFRGGGEKCHWARVVVGVRALATLLRALGRWQHRVDPVLPHLEGVIVVGFLANHEMGPVGRRARWAPVRSVGDPGAHRHAQRMATGVF